MLFKKRAKQIYAKKSFFYEKHRLTRFRYVKIIKLHKKIIAKIIGITLKYVYFFIHVLRLALEVDVQ